MVYSFGWIAKNNDWDGPEQKEYFKEYDRLLKPYKKELKKLAQQDTERFDGAKKLWLLPSLEFNQRMEIVHPAYQKFQPLFEAHRQKVQEGIDLFAKYFGSFWL